MPFLLPSNAPPRMIPRRLLRLGLLVVRNDTIVYERYLAGYTDSTRSSSFSVAKSVTSALVGIALGSGAIRSLDHAGGTEKVASGFNATARDYARFGRLYLNGGAWNGEQLVPREWVDASTTLDTTRTEPEVPTWWRMQHNHLWWIPMHNWAAERDFFADGSKGQRLYVHPPTKTIIVQLADQSNQDFPFRRIAHYLAGEPYRFPQPIASLLLRAIQTQGIDSARTLFRSLVAEERAHPERYMLNEVGVLAVGRTFMGKRATIPTAVAVFELAAERFPESCATHTALANGVAALGDARRAAEERGRAVALCPRGRAAEPGRR